MQKFCVWTTHSLDRVRKTRQPQANKDFALFGAKGEYESFQIVIHSMDEPLCIKNITFTEFSKNGEKLCDNIDVYREHYISFDKNSHHKGVEGVIEQEIVGTIPDALIPALHPITREPLGNTARFYAFPHEMPAGDLQPYFIDVKIPREAKSGIYSSEYTVETDKGDFKGNVTLNVWDVELPKAQVQKSFFGSWTDGSPLKSEVAAQHRIFIKANDLELQEKLHEKYGYNTSHIGFWSGADIDRPNMNPAPETEAVVERLKKYSPKTERFAYTADEIGWRKDLYPEIIRYGQALHKAGAKQLVVMPPVNELFDDGLGTGRSAVDIWVVLPKQYYEYKKNIERAIAKGDTIWTYNCLIQDNYSPKWLMDFSLMCYRLQPGFINYSLKAEGFLYWLIDGYQKLQDPWGDITVNPDKYGDTWVRDGMLFYPSEDVGFDNGFVPSLRAKAVRDGFEDYELCHQIAASGKGAMADHYSNIIGKDFKCWTDNPEELLLNRRELGNAFSRWCANED